MKVLQVNNYHYLNGGSETVYLETSRLLEEKGHHIIPFSVRDADAEPNPYEDYFVDPVNFLGASPLGKIRLAARFCYSSEAGKKLEKLLSRERPDIAHLHIFYGRITSSILPVLRRYRVPVVMTVHEYRMLCPVYTFLDGEGKVCEKCASGRYYHCVVNRCNKTSLSYSAVSALECLVRDSFIPYEKYIDAFIMVSDFIRRKHLFYRPSLADRMVLIHNFVDTRKLSPNHEEGTYNLYVGRLSREKGIFTILAACKDRPGLRLKIAGRGPLEGEIRRYLRENGMTNVELTGFVRDRQLAETVQNARFVLAASEWYENFPLSVLEALALGKPVISSRSGGLPEMVEDGRNGFLFDTGDVGGLRHAIDRAEALSLSRYREMSLAARASVERKFGPETYYEKIMGLYRGIIVAAEERLRNKS